MYATRADSDLNLLGLSWVRTIWFINNIRIKLVSTAVAGLIGFILVAGSYGAVTGLTRLVELHDIWHRFDVGTANKMTLLGELRQHLGYGGMIDGYLRHRAGGGAAHLQAFRTSLERLRAVVPAYRIAGSDDAERAALDQILAAAAAYEAAVQAGPQAAVPAEVDAAAIAALDLLSGRLSVARRDDADRVEASVDQMTTTIVVVFVGSGALLVVLAVFLTWFTRFRLVAPMYSLRDGMVELSRGRRDIAIGYLEKQDEIGDMARALQVFKDNAERAERMKAEHEAQKQAAEAERRHEMLQLADSLEDKVKSVVHRVAAGADNIKATAESMSSHIGGGANRSLGAVEASQASSAKVNEMAEAAIGLAGSMEEVLRGVNESVSVAGRAVAQAGQSEAEVRSLAEAASRIGEVLALINDIAEKTNLLALNATIEAARAGEAGKGFAVVASEVKTLANQTTRATEEIAAQIDAIQSATNDTVASIQGIGGAIRETSEVASRIAELVVNYGSSTRRIAEEAREVSQQTESVSENVVSIAHTSASSCGASIQVIWAADDLYAPIRVLEDEVNGFLETIRKGG